MLVSCFNKCVIMRLWVKLDFAASHTFPRIYYYNKNKYYKEPEQSFLSLLRICGMPLWEGGHPLLHPLPTAVVWPYCAVVCRHIYDMAIISRKANVQYTAIY